MKKVICFLLAGIMILSVSLCYATDTVEQPDDAVDIDNYEDLEDVANDGITQEELKAYYDEYMKMMESYYQTYERTNTVRARVINAGDLETVYNMD